ncbi:TOBE domain-containing protein [Glaesserella parasuis]|uniref:TOBE domain-containing protein n=1 Tax=Glaesserella parasuis TaxID=738 RepID=A0A6M8SY99_GLAPU|nr:TOBE domain-containing protein [Glaesserella parasuis]MDD2168057.1 TOBE domain-containing protein [Glaesserella parasuis]MDG6259971.1 TOBE domain-containing protein [Glaesserella parasuis]MDG6274743.1 TOBE domain-containing protein [Glaesserella parasuis]MDG6278932.1 TOBE domain-containing protein [Glaesserella parasuis]MDG6283001.1 TOBE domain-containing protein [Glaesserella parasuis]
MLNNEILLTIKLKQQLFVDPKRITLLKAIQECGSINQAAKNANVSYKSAWDHLEAMNNISPKPLLERNTGGKHGGGTALTPYAERLLQLYDLLEQTQAKAFAILQDESIPLDSLLTATAKFSLQSSARNQFFGTVTQLREEDVHCYVDIHIAEFPQDLTASITAQSAARLKLTQGKEVMLMVKAPWIEIHPEHPQRPNSLAAKVEAIYDKGEYKEIALNANGTECYATVKKAQPLQENQQVWIHIDPEQIVLVTI